MADGKRENSHTLGNKPSSKAICILFHPESNFSSLILFTIILICPMNVGSCHHGMARPQVAGGGTASYMEGSCE
jgi:hypothetical protein